MPENLTDESAQAIVHAVIATLKLQIKLTVSASQNILTPGKPVPVLALQREAHGGRPQCTNMTKVTDMTLPGNSGDRSQVSRS